MRQEVAPSGGFTIVKENEASIARERENVTVCSDHTDPQCQGYFGRPVSDFRIFSDFIFP